VAARIRVTTGRCGSVAELQWPNRRIVVVSVDDFPVAQGLLATVLSCQASVKLQMIRKHRCPGLPWRRSRGAVVEVEFWCMTGAAGHQGRVPPEFAGRRGWCQRGQ